MDHTEEKAPESPLSTTPRSRKKTSRAVARWLKRGALLAALVGLAVVIGLAFVPKPVPVDLAEVARGAMRVTVDEDGRTRVSDRYVLSAPLSGNLARIELHAGDAVTQGQVIARLVPLARPLMDAQTRAETEARVAAGVAQLRQARASVDRARVATEFADTQAARTRQLQERGSLSAEALDRAELERRSRREEMASAEFGVRVAAHQLEMARSALSRLDGARAGANADAVDAEGGGEQLEVSSPIDGTVLRVIQESAGAVNAGAPLLELGDATHLEVAVDVLTSDAVHIEAGDRVIIERWGGEAALDGHVRMIEPSAFTRTSALGVEEQRVNVVIDLDSPREAWARLGDGYRVETRIVIWEEQDVLSVPASAVFRHGDGFAVYQRAGEVATLTPVEAGRRNGLAVQITSGLEEGTQVVLHPSDRVVEGVAIVGR